MVAEAIKDASPRSGIILDSFLGSGTTILAAEKVGRICFGIEYEPKYCDLAIRRWQEFAGRDAVLETSRQTYEDVKAERTAAEIGSAPPGAASTSEDTSGRA